MSNHQSVKEMLGTKFGNERMTRVMGKVKYAYKHGIRGEALTIYLKDVLVKEGMASSSSINPDYVLDPPIIYPHGL